MCVVETTKASIEVESPAEGLIRQLCRAGEEVGLGGRIAFVAASEQELAGIEPPAERPAPAAAPHSDANATRKAVELADRHGIDLATIEKEGFITAEDVQAVVARAAETSTMTGGRLDGTSTENVSLPVYFGLDETVGRLDEAFLASLRSDPERFAALPEEERLDAYRAHGARIGESVRLGTRTVVVAPQIVLDDGVELGDRSLVRCEEVVAVGALTRFGPDLRLTCRRAYVGAGGWIGRGVVIGGGGHHDPWATFAAGDLLFLGDEAFVNPCRPVLIGREVFLTMRSVIVTHNVGHSLLEGFENRFAAVVLEDRAQIGIGTVVYAGCRIGREAIIGSNSYVVSDIPAGKLAIGVPARVAGSASRVLTRERQSRLLQQMLDELAELLERSGVEVSRVEHGRLRGIQIRHDGRTSAVLAVERLDKDFRPPATDGETVVLALEAAGEPSPSFAVLDLLGRRVHGEGDVILDSAREFCRKRGIRFEPGPWRYRRGLL